MLVHASRLQTERDKQFASNQEKIISILEGLQQTMQRIAYNMDMTKKVNIAEFIPVRSLSSLTKFLDKSDGQFHLRREEFENNLYCTVTNTIKLKRPFENSLLAFLFTRDFLSSHRWPGPR